MELVSIGIALGAALISASSQLIGKWLERRGRAERVRIETSDGRQFDVERIKSLSTSELSELLKPVTVGNAIAKKPTA